MRRKSDIDPSTQINNYHSHVNCRHDLQNNQIRGSDKFVRFQSPQNINLSKSKSRSKIKMIVGNIQQKDKQRNQKQKNNKNMHQNNYQQEIKKQSLGSKNQFKIKGQKHGIYLPKSINMNQYCGDPFQSHPSSTNHTMIIKPSSNLSSQSGGYYITNPNKQTTVKNNLKKKNQSHINSSNNTKVNKKLKNATIKITDKQKIMLILNDSATKIQAFWRGWKARKQIQDYIQKIKSKQQIKNNLKIINKVQKTKEINQRKQIEKIQQNFNKISWQKHIQMNKCVRPNNIRKITQKQSQMQQSSQGKYKKQLIYSPQSSSNDTFLDKFKDIKKHNNYINPDSEISSKSMSEIFSQNENPTKKNKINLQSQEQQTPGKTPCGKNLQPNYNLLKYDKSFNNKNEQNKKQLKNKKNVQNQSSSSQNIDLNFNQIKISSHHSKLLEKQFYQDRLNSSNPSSLNEKTKYSEQKLLIQSSSQSDKQKSKTKLSFNKNLFNFSIASSPSKRPSSPHPFNSHSGKKNTKPYQDSFHSYNKQHQYSCQSPNLFSSNHKLKSSINQLLSQCKKMLHQGKIQKLLSIQDKFRDEQITQRSYQTGMKKVSKDYEQKIRQLEQKQKQMMGNWKRVLQICEDIKKNDQSNNIKQFKQKQNQKHLNQRAQSFKKKKFADQQQNIHSEIKIQQFPQSFKFKQNFNNLKKQIKKTTKRQKLQQQGNLCSPIVQFTKQLKKQISLEQKYQMTEKLEKNIKSSLIQFEIQSLNQAQSPISPQIRQKIQHKNQQIKKCNKNSQIKIDRNNIDQVIDIFLLPQLINDFCLSVNKSKIQPKMLINKLKKSYQIQISPIQHQYSNQIKIENDNFFQEPKIRNRKSKPFQKYPSIEANNCQHINTWLLDISHYILDRYLFQLKESMIMIQKKQPNYKILMQLIRSNAGDMFQQQYQVICNDIYIIFEKQYRHQKARHYQIDEKDENNFFQILASFHLALMNCLNQVLIEQLKTGRHWIQLPYIQKPRFLQQKNVFSQDFVKLGLEQAINRVSSISQYCISPLKQFQQGQWPMQRQQWLHVQQDKKILLSHEQTKQILLYHNFESNKLLIQLSDQIIWPLILQEAIKEINI